MSGVSSTSSSSNRYWGLASGLDVDSIVEGLCSDVQDQIDEAEADEQTLKWQQTAYRDVISALDDFQDAYLSLTGDSTMAKSSTYTSYSTSSSNTSLITATANASADGASQVIDVIQSATSASLESSGAICGSITGSTDLSSVDVSSLEGQSFTMTVGGVTATMTFTSDDVSNASTVEDLINNKLGDTFGTVPEYDSSGDLTGSTTSKVTASIDSSTGYLTLSDATGYESTAFSVATSTAGSSDSSVDALTALGLTDGSSNRLGTSVTLDSLLGTTTTDEIYVNINGVSVDIGTGSSTLADAISAINKSDAGVTAAYDSTSDTVTLTSATTGGSGTVTISDSAVDSTDCSQTTALFSSLNITDTSASGQDAVISINGTKYAESSNNFTIDGVTYKINSTVTSSDTADNTANITFLQDSSALETSLENFISAYNDLVDTITSYTETAPDDDYYPLTDDEKDDMSESEIETWNDKADDGVIYQDSTLESILTSMRSVLYQSVTLDDGSTISLYDIGITTSDDYDDYGKLEIKDDDLDTFQTAISTKAGDIAELFTQTSDTLLSGTSSNSVRTASEGLVDRLDDIIKGATGNVYGTYGSLLKIAGTSTSCTYDNTIYDEIQDKEDEIDDLKDKLSDKQDRLYDEFEALETYMSTASTQSNLISSMLGS
jgi:flagellar hook-associated protein 2